MVTDQTSYVEYAGNNSTSTAYSIPFSFKAVSDIKCYVDGAAYTTFTISGSSLTTATAVAATSVFRIERDQPDEQTMSLVAGGDLSSSVLEATLDKLALSIQQVRDRVNRSLAVSRASTETEPAEMDATTNHYVFVNGSGNVVARTKGQVASDISAELDLPSTLDRPTAVAADATARAALAPDFTGQVLVQLSPFAVYYGTGTSAGNWGQSFPVFYVADKAARDAATPAAAGALYIQLDTLLPYVAESTTTGDFKLFGTGESEFGELVSIGDGAYTWHTHPCNVEVDGTWYLGSVASDGTKKAQAAKWVNDTLTSHDLRTAAADDDHISVAFAYDPRGSSIIITSADHSQNNNIFVYESTDDLATTPTLLRTLTTGNGVTYQQLWRDPNSLDKLRMWSRDDDSGFYAWQLRVSSDKFATTSNSEVLKNHYFYVCPDLDGVGTHCFCFGWPGAGQTPAITHLFHRYSDDALLTGGVVIDSNIVGNTVWQNGMSRNWVVRGIQPYDPPAWNTTNWTAGSSTTGPDGTNDTLTVWNNASNTSCYTYQDIHTTQSPYTLTDNHPYILSFYAKGNQSANIGVRPPGYASGAEIVTPITTSWKFYSFPIEGKTFSSANLDRLYFDASQTPNSWGGSGFQIAFDKIQLEEGNTATPGVRTFEDDLYWGANPVIIEQMAPGVGGTSGITPDTKKLRFLDAWQFEAGYLEVAWAQFDSYNGCHYATYNNQSSCHYWYGRLNLSNWQVEEKRPIALTGDGLESTYFGYVGGLAILEPRKVVYAQNNLAGSGNATLNVATSCGGGWQSRTLYTTSSELFQPQAQLVQTYLNSKLRYHRNPGKVRVLEGSYVTWTNFDMTMKSAREVRVTL